MVYLQKRMRHLPEKNVCSGNGTAHALLSHLEKKVCQKSTTRRASKALHSSHFLKPRPWRPKRLNGKASSLNSIIFNLLGSVNGVYHSTKFASHFKMVCWK